LTAIVVENGSASYGWPEGIARRFDLEGWDAVTVDGRDHDELAAAMSRNHVARPVCVVAEVRR
jgi:transketolase